MENLYISDHYDQVDEDNQKLGLWLLVRPALLEQPIKAWARLITNLWWADQLL